MSSSDFFYALKDGFYWFFENILEAIGDNFWIITLIFGFLAFGYWMLRQVRYNRIAENDPNQIK